MDTSVFLSPDIHVDNKGNTFYAKKIFRYRLLMTVVPGSYRCSSNRREYYSTIARLQFGFFQFIPSEIDCSYFLLPYCLCDFALKYYERGSKIY